MMNVFLTTMTQILQKNMVAQFMLSQGTAVQTMKVMVSLNQFQQFGFVVSSVVTIFNVGLSYSFLQDKVVGDGSGGTEASADLPVGSGY